MTETMLQPTSSLDALLERLSPEAHLRGKEFERAAKWFLDTDPAYASELREVWLWDDWPGRWGPDIGIDLVAETQEGKLWAIQDVTVSPRLSYGFPGASHDLTVKSCTTFTQKTSITFRAFPERKP